MILTAASRQGFLGLSLSLHRRPSLLLLFLARFCSKTEAAHVRLWLCTFKFMFKSRRFCTAKVVYVYLWFGAASLHNAAEILHGHCPRLGCMQKCWTTMNASKQVGFRVRSFLNVGLDKKKYRCVCNFLRYLQSTTARPLEICQNIYFRVPSCFSSSMLRLLVSAILSCTMCKQLNPDPELFCFLLPQSSLSSCIIKCHLNNFYSCLNVLRPIYP